jgi:hypothetical protein
MAEINIQRSKSSNALWWILGIVAVVLIVWLLFTWTGGTRTVSTDVPGLPLAVAFSEGVTRT